MSPYPEPDLEDSPDHLLGETQNSPTATAGCCFGTYVDDDIHAAATEITQLDRNQQPNRGNGNRWPARIVINCAENKIWVTIIVQFEDKSADTELFPGTVAHGEIYREAVQAMNAAQNSWNRRGYKLNIVDRKCGRKLYDVVFEFRQFRQGERPHITMWLVNVPRRDKNIQERFRPPLTSYRSYVTANPERNPYPNFCKYNVQDSGALSHEFAHMIGLKDEYYDYDNNRGGSRYEMLDGSVEFGYPHRSGINGDVAPVAGTRFSPQADILNSGDRKAGPPIHPRNCITVARTVRAILNRRGHQVQSVEII